MDILDLDAGASEAGVLPLPDAGDEVLADATLTPLESAPTRDMVAGAPLINIDDNLTDGQRVNGLISVVGFAQIPNSEGRVDVFVDGQKVGEATFPTFREDVPNSGFIFDLDTGALAEGPHDILVRSFGADGAAIADTGISVVVDRPDRLGFFDTPARSSAHEGDLLTVSGWAVDNTGFQSLEVLANGELLGTVAPGTVARPDVAEAFNAGTANLGFQGQLDIGALPSGPNVLTLVGVNGEGSRSELAETVFVNAAPTGTFGFVETPTPRIDSSVDGGVTVSGWVAGDAPVDHVEIHLNDREIVEAELSQSRGDVAAAFPDSAFAAGFTAAIPDLFLIPGDHEVRVIAVDADGDRTVLSGDGDGQRDFRLHEADRLLGAHLRPTNDFSQSIENFANEIGQTPEITMYFQGWQVNSGARNTFNEFPFLPEEVRGEGSIPMVTWESWRAGGGFDQPEFSLDNIIAGNWDDLIRAYAQEVAAFGSDVLIRFDHEFNGDANIWTGIANGNDPQKYVAMWRHVVDIFEQEGADNARWIWAPNFKAPPDLPRPSNDFRNYYPGDGYVDFIGVSAYNWGNDPINGSGWQEADTLYPNFMAQIGREYPDKPLIVSEIGTFPDYDGNSAAQWIRDAFELFQGFSQMKSVVWFNDFAFADPNGTDFRVAVDNPSFGDVPADRTQAFREAATAWGDSNLTLS